MARAKKRKSPKKNAAKKAPKKRAAKKAPKKRAAKKAPKKRAAKKAPKKKAAKKKVVKKAAKKKVVKKAAKKKVVKKKAVKKKVVKKVVKKKVVKKAPIRDENPRKAPKAAPRKAPKAAPRKTNPGGFVVRGAGGVRIEQDISTQSQAEAIASLHEGSSIIKLDGRGGEQIIQFKRKKAAKKKAAKKKPAKKRAAKKAPKKAAKKAPKKAPKKAAKKTGKKKGPKRKKPVAERGGRVSKASRGGCVAGTMSRKKGRAQPSKTCGIPKDQGLHEFSVAGNRAQGHTANPGGDSMPNVSTQQLKTRLLR